MRDKQRQSGGILIILKRTVRQQDWTVAHFKAPVHFASDPVAQRYDPLFSWLDWTQVPEKEHMGQRGRLPHPVAAYIKAYWVMLNEGLNYHSKLHDCLCEHPALVWLMVWRLAADTTSVYGFDVTASVPSAHHLRRKPGQLDSWVLGRLLGQTVQQALEVIPGVGDTVSVDTKHIYAV